MNLLGVGLAVFVIIYFITKKPHFTNDYVVITFIILLATPIINQLIREYFFYRIIKNALIINAIPLTFGPMLYIYSSMIINKTLKVNLKYLFHFIPFIILFLFLITSTTPAHQRKNNNLKHPIKERHDFMRPPHPQHIKGDIINPRPRKMPISILLIYLLSLISFIIYSFHIFILLKKHKINIFDYFSFKSSGINLYWLETLAIIFIITNSYILIAYLSAFFQIRHPLLNPVLSFDRGYVFFLAIFSFFALQQERLFYKHGYIPEQTTTKNKKENDNTGKYEKSGLTDEIMERHLKKINDIMLNDKPFYNQEFTLADLSEKSGISKHYISQTINIKLKQNFYNYINEFRINDVINKMKDKFFKNSSIIDLTFSAGFNSKSSFNTYFKKVTNQTPKDFRNKISL